MTPERRKFKRIPSSLDIQWDSPAEIGAAAQVTNLSVNGCFIETQNSAAENPPQIGQLISFVIVFPEGAKLAVAGRVMYKNPPRGFGVLFTPLSLEQRSLITSYITEMVEYFAGGNESPANYR
ncbi:MAG TPA: PilZ domain-containing protein [Pyrinomonadaceae bacterium]|jgi:hypothetical protein|nr:PilZ domain-containing protein [Pyrinomonadaceae bacterium]